MKGCVACCLIAAMARRSLMVAALSVLVGLSGLSAPERLDAAVELIDFTVEPTPPPPLSPTAPTDDADGDRQQPLDTLSSSNLDATQEYDSILRSQSTVGALDTGLLGESIDYYTGQTDFVATDVSLPGNFALPVAVGRRYRVANHAGGTLAGAFGDWDIEIPHIEGIVATSVGWTVGGANADKRCSYFGAPPAASVTSSTSSGSVTTSVPASEYGYGFAIVVPGEGRHEMLLRAAGNTQSPGSEYPVVTNDWWAATCVARYGSTTGKADEAFMVTSPDGVTYSFLQYSARPYPPYQRPADTTQAGVMAVVNRQQAFFLPTSIEDRFGNWVSYSYTTIGGQLMPNKITSSDGRTITINYSGNTVSSITDGTRTWTYGYSAGALTRVNLPDASFWSINFANLNTAGWSYANATCTSLPTPTYSGGVSGGSVSGTIQHPAGASGTFTFTVQRHGRNNAPSTCLRNSAGVNFAAVEPSVYDVLSLTRKQISGPYISGAMTWTLAYAGCGTSSCNATKTTTLNDARGYNTLYTFGAYYSANADTNTEGQLQSLKSGGTGSNYLRTDSYAYFSASGHPYPNVTGTPAQARGDVAALTALRPMQQHTISVDGTAYFQTLSNPDSFGYPQTITRSGTNTKVDTLTYSHNTSAWILGTVRQVQSAGVTELFLTLNSNSLPTQIDRFGRKIKGFTYNNDGTVYSTTDGNGQLTRYSNYYRGIPQAVIYPNNDSESVAVNNIGAITSHTNAGYTTTYDHDTMGRVSGIHPPAYSPTSIAWNVTAGGSKRTETRGSYTRTDFYDGLLHHIETDEPGGRTVVRHFDPDGRNTFTSYPASSLGITNAYDGIGRLSKQTDGLGYTKVYTPSANSLSVGDWNGNATTYLYKAYDEPTYDWPTSIVAPQYTTSITRDIWGKPTSITRGIVNRTYGYNANQLLQTISMPESGPTTFTYDNAANVKTITRNGTYTQTRYYDARNRLTNIDYSGGSSPSVILTWLADNLPNTATRGNVTRTYAYNSGRLLASETIKAGGSTYGIGYGYNTNAQGSSQTYPDGTTVLLSPDVFGRPTQIGSYATNFSYYNSGLLHQFEYGNTVYHTTTYDNRQLPSESADAGVFDWAYAYDGNGNPTRITDYIGVGTNTKSLTYDTANRLKTANATKLWGNTTYTYDNFDNLTGDVTGTATTTFTIDGSNRLSSVGGTPISYDTRGNIVQKGTGTNATTYAFDGANLLTRVQQDGDETDYTYDADGLRATTMFTSNTEPGSQVASIYDHTGKLLFEATTAVPNRDVIFANGFEIPANPITTTKYLYVGNHVIARDTKSGATDTVTYVHTDALGSPVAQTNASKAVIGTTTRKPYGDLYTTTGTGDQAGIGYAGHYADATGLVYMQARYYDPQLRRFLSVDPQGVDAVTALNFNRYSYAANSPYAKFDPNGREVACEAVV